MIRTKYLSLAIAAALAACACSKAANTNANVPANANANTAPANTASANDPGNGAGSPTEVYKAAYAARKNCDLPVLKQVLSNDILKFMTDMGKAEKKSLDDELKELCQQPQASTAQARKEEIKGDQASLEYLEENGEWRPMYFIREDGVWKMSPGPGDEEFPEDVPNKKEDKDDNRS